MKRTTVMLPDDLAYLLERERRRRGVSAAAIVREAVAAHFNMTSEPRHIPFAALVDSGIADIGENFEQYLDEAWGSEECFNQTMGRYPDTEQAPSSRQASSGGVGSEECIAERIDQPSPDKAAAEAVTHGD